jgi:hypothetical protein
MASLRKEKSVAVLQIRPCGFVQFFTFSCVYAHLQENPYDY